MHCLALHECLLGLRSRGHLTTETVEGAALTFEGIDDVHGGHSLPLCMLGVGDCIPDDILEENLEHTTGLFVDEARDTLDTTTAGKTTNCRFGDTLDIITKNLTMTLGASLSEPLSSLASTSHDSWVIRK